MASEEWRAVVIMVGVVNVIALGLLAYTYL
jgi:hypothetical protein